jgi:phage-related protein
MYKIYFYKDSRGHQPIKEYILELAAKQDKSSRIKLNKIQEYMEVLQANGTRAGIPYVKHLDGKIWELRPLSDRILFAAWVDDKIILLHHFTKKTQKTPSREVEQAKRNLKAFLERTDLDE